MAMALRRAFGALVLPTSRVRAPDVLRAIKSTATTNHAIKNLSSRAGSPHFLNLNYPTLAATVCKTMTKQQRHLNTSLPLNEEPATVETEAAVKPHTTPTFVQRKFVVVQIGGKQFKVTEGDQIVLNRLHADVGKTILLQKVLMVGSSNWTAIGTPIIDANTVTVRARIEDHHRGKKIQVFKKKRRKGYARRQGHRQNYTTLSIVEIDCEGPSEKA
eukprot:m.27159 g.27159  ORF g.27159 m.27159 type:complete len:216 (-) comp15695_c1_seq1:162-809(-)